jgi:hypothetical protein
MQPQNTGHPIVVIPAKAGIQFVIGREATLFGAFGAHYALDSSLRWNDGSGFTPPASQGSFITAHLVT